MAVRPLHVWLVDDDASIRWVLERALKQSGMLAKTFEHANAALEALRGEVPDVLITDIRMPGNSGLELLQEIHESRPTLPVIVMTAHSDLDSAVPSNICPNPSTSITRSTWCGARPTRVSPLPKATPNRRRFPKSLARRPRCNRYFARLAVFRAPA